MSNKKKQGAEKSAPCYSQNHVYSTLSDESKITLTLNTIEKIYNQASASKKKAYFMLGIKRSENEIFVIEGTLKLERRNHK